MPSERSRSAPPRVVLFDLDDTLIDHSDSVRAAVGRVRARFPELRRVGTVDLALVYQRELERAHPAIVRGELTVDSARRARMRRLFEEAGVSPDPATVRAAIGAYRTAYRSARRRLPGVVGVARALRRHGVVGILSNNRRREQEEKLTEFGLASAFDFLLTSEELGRAKPDPEAFLSAVAAAGSVPRRAVMVGDSWRVDIEGARRAGLAAVWINRWGQAAPRRRLVPQLTGFTPVEAAVRTILSARPPRSRGKSDLNPNVSGSPS